MLKIDGFYTARLNTILKIKAMSLTPVQTFGKH